MTDQVAFVTGSSRGIGRAIAQRLAQDGALVVVHYANQATAAARTVEEILAAGGRAFALQGDLSSTTQIQRLYEELDKELVKRTGSARFDLLVNNAAIGTFSPFGETSEKEFDRIVALNMKGTFFVIQSALSRLRDGGKIINLSSSATRRPSHRAIAATMTKAALNVLTTALAAELGGRNITVNTLAPGATETDMNAAALTHPEAREFLAGKTALGRVGRAGDIAGVAAFLASDDGAWVTGQYLEASGGLDL